MRIEEFDYDLPEELIAQRPAEQRDACRLLVMDRGKGTIEHKHFYEITDYLKKGDCLVMNNSKVIPARLLGVKEKTGAKAEFLLTKRLEDDLWETMVRPGKRLKPGDCVKFADDFRAEIEDYGPGGTRKVRFRYKGVFAERLEELGKTPLPPYIQRESDPEDRAMYQTVYCTEEGSVAAPTAGLHFTGELMEKIREKGVKLASVTLHVGIGTFRPVKCENVEDHRMHFEEYFIGSKDAETINGTIKEGGRIVSVGTTSVRALESAAFFDEAAGRYLIKAGSGNTGIFIYPGYGFRIPGSLITNFHLPKSTLLMLVSALYDREKILAAYKTAIKEKYRFLSYGDATLIL